MWVRAIVAVVLFICRRVHFYKSEKRIARLIGNRDYRAGVGSLSNPLNDVRIVGAALKSVGFEVLRHTHKSGADPNLGSSRILGDRRPRQKISSAGGHLLAEVVQASAGTYPTSLIGIQGLPGATNCSRT